MSKLWRWWLPAYVLLAPFALVYVAFLFVTFTRPTAWRWHEGVLTCVSKRGALPFGAAGQGWSWVVAFSDEEQRQAQSLRVHEYTHVGQEFVCSMAGVLAFFACGLADAWAIGVISAFAGTAFFHLAYGVTWLYALATAKGAGFASKYAHYPRWWRAYLSIPWEVHAYEVQDEADHGLHARSWGASVLH